MTTPAGLHKRFVGVEMLAQITRHAGLEAMNDELNLGLVFPPEPEGFKPRARWAVLHHVTLTTPVRGSQVQHDRVLLAL